MSIRIKRGTTISELRWPKEKSEFTEITQEWSPDLITQALKFVWLGCDLLENEVLNLVNCKQADKQIEKNISSLLQIRINRAMSGDEPFDVQHEVPEFETSYSDQAQPPSYDIAFLLRSNERIIFPLEAKVLHTENKLSPYIKEIKSNFLTCRYAPLSSEGGMLGYLLKGDCAKAFSNIEKAISCQLNHHPAFQEREHKTSDHRRIVQLDKSYPVKFRCHHLVLQLTKNSDLKQAQQIISDELENIDLTN
jgi:hypothetical protein